MKVCLRLRVGPRVSRGAGKNRHLASALASLLWPAVLTAYSLALWALAAQLKLTGDFDMQGVFSHWQVWAVIALLTHFTAMALSRYGKYGDVRVALNFLSWFTTVTHRRETQPPA